MTMYANYIRCIGRDLAFQLRRNHIYVISSREMESEGKARGERKVDIIANSNKCKMRITEYIHKLIS